MSQQATIIALADAVVASLNAPSAGFALAFTAVRKMLPIYTLEQMANLHVVVAPGVRKEDRDSPSVFTGDYAVDIVIQQRLDPQGNPEADPPADLESNALGLMLLVEQIGDYFKTAMLPVGDYEALITGIENDPAYVLEDLATKSLFTSVLTLKSRIIR